MCHEGENAFYYKTSVQPPHGPVLSRRPSQPSPAQRGFQVACLAALGARVCPWIFWDLLAVEALEADHGAPVRGQQGQRGLRALARELSSLSIESYGGGM